MKHHLYQIYYGGWKVKLIDAYYCRDCDKIYETSDKKLTIHYKDFDKKSTVLS